MKRESERERERDYSWMKRRERDPGINRERERSRDQISTHPLSPVYSGIERERFLLLEHLLRDDRRSTMSKHDSTGIDWDSSYPFARERCTHKYTMSSNLAASIWGINTNSNKPSIFELLLMEQLSDAFRPAFDFLNTVRVKKIGVCVRRRRRNRYFLSRSHTRSHLCSHAANVRSS